MLKRGESCRDQLYCIGVERQFIRIATFLVGGAGYGKIAKGLSNFWNNGKDKRVMSHPTSPSDFRQHIQQWLAYDAKQ